MGGRWVWVRKHEQSGKLHAPGRLKVPWLAIDSTSIMVRVQLCNTSVLLRHMLLFSTHHGSAFGATVAPAELRQSAGAA